MKKYRLIFIVAAALFFFWASWQTRLCLKAPGSDANRPQSPAGSAPLVALTTGALGGFRGLLVDILWMRLISLQKQGKVFEIVQLADWITKLESQFSSVWAFHAWNMAYNISVLYANPEHRWMWVQNGIQLLRDRGLKYNPHDTTLNRELGWLYQHKIGQTMDDMHLYYKKKLAAEMAELFTGPRPDYASTDERMKRMRREYKLIPEIMLAIEQAYGRLDWRLPESHALYWAYRGLFFGNGGNDTNACDHMIFQCMAAAFRQGRLYMDKNADVYITTPRFDLLPGAKKAYEDAIKRRETDIFRQAYANFLDEAVFILHSYGEDHEARITFDSMLAQMPSLRNEMNFETYILLCEQSPIADLPMVDAIARIEGLLYQSYATPNVRNITDANALREKALKLWKEYAQGRQKGGASKQLPDFALIDEQAKQRALDRMKADSPSARQ